MFELIALGILVVFGLALAGIVWAALSLVFWVVLLPFKLLGLAFRGVAVLFALPFILVFGLVGALVFGAGVLLFLFPLVPFALLVLAAIWLVRRNRRGTVSATS